MNLTAKRIEAMKNLPAISEYNANYLRNAVSFIRNQYIKGREGALFDDASYEQAQLINEYVPKICEYLGIPIKLTSYTSTIPYIEFK